MTGKLITQAQYQALCDRLKALEGNSGGIDKAAVRDCVDEVRPCCDGPFVAESTRTGWWSGWTPILTANTGTVTAVPWRTVGNQPVTAPDCPTDLAVSSFLGNEYRLERDSRLYVWYDWRLLVNGAAVFTRTFDAYHYRDSRTDTDGGVRNPLEPMATLNGTRLNIPAGATVEAQAQLRYRVANAGALAYQRLIAGLRSRTVYQFHHRETVIKEEGA
jgi:hypothetical protein